MEGNKNAGNAIRSKPIIGTSINDDGSCCGRRYFFMWCSYVYVTSRCDWFEEDVRIRNAEKSYNLARAEQIRLESLALNDRLEKGGIDTREKEFF
ncbi:hypothetical protein [Litchfieldella rifensis]|uniref:Uncharacterized protein n=1 Tax=Litchfieldella rifensis TaxID=762643 RepID=A0ABV7LKD0_9GAMM